MKILIVGHGEYATGIKSAIKLLTGVSNNIDAINLNEELTHNDYTVMVQEYVANNKDLIIFADIFILFFRYNKYTCCKKDCKGSPNGQ